MGAVLFVGLSLGQISMAQVIRPLVLFLIPMVVVLLLVTYLEPITMWIPALLFGY